MFAGGGERNGAGEGASHISPWVGCGQPLKPWPRRRAGQAIGGPLGRASRTAGVITNRLTDRAVTRGRGRGMPAPHHQEPQMPSKPTTRQLNYLRSLATRTGQTFTYPKTRQQASEEIDRLKHTRPSSRSEVRIERKLIADQIAAGPIDAARVREHEISGHGSSATWAHNRHQEPAAENPAPASRPRTPSVGKRTELARYRTPAGERVLYGQRVDGIVRLTDRPEGAASASQRAYLVERDLQTKPELDAVIADYLSQAAKLGEPPMARCPLESYLEAIA